MSGRIDNSRSVAMPLSVEEHDLLALHLVPGLGPRLTKALLDRFGSPAAALQATPSQLSDIPHIGDKLARRLSDAMRTVDVNAELELLERHNVRLLPLGGPSYPPPVAQIPDPPSLLYVRGAWEARDANAVAIVGSRHCSSYGRRVAERLADGLARAGFTVVSGLPLGTSLETIRSGRRWISPLRRSLLIRPFLP